MSALEPFAKATLGHFAGKAAPTSPFRHPAQDTVELTKKDADNLAPGRWQKFKNVFSCFWESLRNVFSKKSKPLTPEAIESVQASKIDDALKCLTTQINTSAYNQHLLKHWPAEANPSAETLETKFTQAWGKDPSDASYALHQHLDREHAEYKDKSLSDICSMLNQEPDHLNTLKKKLAEEHEEADKLILGAFKDENGKEYYDRLAETVRDRVEKHDASLQVDGESDVAHIDTYRTAIVDWSQHLGTGVRNKALTESLSKLRGDLRASCTTYNNSKHIYNNLQPEMATFLDNWKLKKDDPEVSTTLNSNAVENLRKYFCSSSLQERKLAIQEIKRLKEQYKKHSTNDASEVDKIFVDFMIQFEKDAKLDTRTEPKQRSAFLYLVNEVAPRDPSLTKSILVQGFGFLVPQVAGLGEHSSQLLSSGCSAVLEKSLNPLKHPTETARYIATHYLGWQVGTKTSRSLFGNHWASDLAGSWVGSRLADTLHNWLGEVKEGTVKEKTEQIDTWVEEQLENWWASLRGKTS